MTPSAPMAPRPGLLVAAALVLSLVGCGRPAGVLFEPPGPRPAWPSPPQTPRVEYVGELRTDRDLKPARGPGRRLGALLLGEDPAQSMLSPIGVCTDATGRVFVADSNAQTLHVFDLSSRAYARWNPPAGQNVFSQPVAVACDSAGRVIVSDSVAGLLFVFGPDGAFIRTMGLGVLRRPCGLVADPATGRLFVADAVAHQIVVLASSGEEVGRIGERGSDPGQFNFPTNVALDGQGRLYVSDTLNFRVQVFTPDLQPLRQFGRKGDRPGYFAQPKGLALDADGHVYVVDANFEAVQVFSSEGQLLLTFGQEGHGKGEFWLPAGIRIDQTGRIWIADTYNKRIQVFQYLPEGRSP